MRACALAGVQEEKRQSLSERQAELAQVRQAAADISRSVADLGDLISKLDKEVAERTGLGSYEKEIAAAPPASPFATTVEPPAGAKPPAAAPPTKQRCGHRRQSGRGARCLDRAGPERRRPRGDADAGPHQAARSPFSEARGILPLPAQGQRVLTFGEKTQYGSQSKGLVLETRHGGQVVSPCDGWIVYAGEFRSYGQLLIINAGGGLSYSTCWTISDRRATGPIRA